MLDLWIASTALAIEAQNVLVLRLLKCSRGGTGAHREANRMVSEKVEAGIDASILMVMGGTAMDVIGSVRKRVDANGLRLSAE
jgi:hypothetical protein